MSEHSAKRQRVGPSEEDEEDVTNGILETPRANSMLRRGQTTLVSADSQSQTSGRSSPSKQMDALELSDFKWNRQLSIDNPEIPDELYEFLTEMSSCNSGIGIISQSLKAELKERSKTDRSFRTFQDFMFADPNIRDAIGYTPLIDEVEQIVNEARECQQYSHPEASWNGSVHFPLLHRAIYGPRRQQKLVGVMNCTTAKLIKEYLKKNTVPKMVDYTFYIDPSADTPAPAHAIMQLRKILPCSVINHTDYRPLRDRPMAVTVETKRRHVSLEAAELQTGTWHSAHWEFLSRRLEKTGGTFDKLSFLPGILVQGHDWSFVVTTREEGKTVVWLEQKFGYTSDMIGVYKAVWGVQRLAKWVDDVYWPWYKMNVLVV
ncbi:hypothetical protein FocnCong_v020117 [Fusarium oxysporum f. sp. conglutinans]|nr:hypothetical protein FocnCong_v020117 [Fusarium oxysporum f. sp. conglutinans]